jgi:hypothetical protein
MGKRRRTGPCWLTILALGCGGNQPPSDPSAAPAPASAGPATQRNVPVPDQAQHLLLVVRATGHRLEVVSARIAPIPLPLNRAPARPAFDDWHVELLDAAGTSMAAIDVHPPDVVRGEFAGADGAIEPHRVTPAMTEFLVRFPVVTGAAAIKVSAAAAPAPGGAVAPARELGRAQLPPLERP